MRNIKDKVRISALAMALSAAGVALAETGPNIVVNGGFENGMAGWSEINPTGKYGGLNYQDRYIDNPCSADTGRADGCFGQNYGMSTLTGRYFKDEKSSGNTEGVYQAITGLTVGDTYQLRFFTTATDFIWQGENQFWKVTFGDQTQNGNAYSPMARDKDANGDLHYYYKFAGNWGATGATDADILRNQRWIATNLSFTATSTTQTLSFRQAQDLDSPWNANTTSVPYGTPAILLLDGITLTDMEYTPPPTVPEPGTASLGLAGLVVVGFFMTRRRREA